MSKRNSGENLFDIQTFPNAEFFCLNCGIVLWAPLNVKGEGRTTCPNCHHDSSVKQYRRKLQVTIYENERHSLFFDDYDYLTETG